jgi:serine phosphatase RsbU (regulator of sigma subunit)
MTATVDPLTPSRDRVRALEDLGFGLAEREERFDRITRLAQQLFGVEIAAVTLVDADTQWIKSERGFPAESVPLEDTFCQVTMVAPEPQTIIEDALVDNRVAANPFVTGDPHVRFYAGQPLTTASGVRIGTLCLVDTLPRRFTEAQREMLAELARWAEAELRRSAEMDRAAEVQRAMFPRAGSLQVPGYEIRGACVAARAVGGDLVDWYRAGDGPDADVVVTLGDVMGKGIGAALMMATVRSALRTAGRMFTPAEAVREAAFALDDDLQGTGTLVTLCQARLTPATGTLTWADAGHGLMVHVRADGEVVRARNGGLPLGALPDDSWPEHEISMRPGDVVVAFSDGLLDLYPSADDAFAAVVGAVREDPAGDWVSSIERFARAADLPDDITVVVIRRCP